MTIRPTRFVIILEIVIIVLTVAAVLMAVVYFNPLPPHVLDRP